MKHKRRLIAILLLTLLFASLLQQLAPTTAKAANTVTEFPIPSGGTPLGIASGPDGNLWFIETNPVNKIGRITPTGQVTEYNVPTADSYASGITAGPDNNMWFTEESANKIGRVTLSGTINEYTIPTSDSVPIGITDGPDGNVLLSKTATKLARSRRQAQSPNTNSLSRKVGLLT